MQKTSLICNNFSGINRSSAVFDSSIITASDIQNVELYSTETNSGVGIRTANGNVSICDLLSEDEQVVNIFESVQKSQSHFFVHSENAQEGKVYLFQPETGDLVEKISGLSLTGKSSATDVAQGWEDLWVFSNSEEIYTIQIKNYDAEGNLDEVKKLELKDVDNRDIKGLGLVVFSGRLWIFSNQVLWYSAQENYSDFSTQESGVVTSAGYIEFVKNITAIYPYLGSLAVFHSNSSCMISVDDETQSFYKSFDTPGGCVSEQALAFHGTQLFFYDDTKKGIFSFQQIINGDKTLGENIALEIQDELFYVPSSEVKKVKMLSVVTAKRNEIWFLLAGGGKYSIVMIYDYLRKTWVKRKSQKLNCINVISGKLYSGGKKLYKEYISQEFDGEFIEAYYKCAPLNLGVENSLKILSYPPKITMDMSYGNDFYLQYTRDYNSLTTKIRHIISKTLKNVLFFDEGFWDKNIFPHEKINSIKRLPSAYFKTLQITFFTKNVGQNFSINNLEFGKIKTKL